MKRRSHDDFILEIFELVGNQYSVMSDFKSVNKKVKIKHNICTYEWGISPSNFLKGTRCPKCAGNARLTYEEVKEHIESFDYSLLSNEYKNARTNLNIQCPKGHIYPVTYDSFKSGKRCGKCVGGIRLDLEYVRQTFINIGLIPLFHEYLNQEQKLEYLCPIHSDQTQFISWNCISQGHSCNKCGNVKKLRFGKDNHSWKGGTTPLIAYLRESINEWKIKSLERHGFVCVLTNKNDMDLEVHHLNKGYTEILNETVSILSIDLKNKINEYTEEELSQIKGKFIELHLIYGLGVPIKRTLHTLFHKTYGYGNNTNVQFNEFRTRFNLGEFDAVI